ncbi:hypothetical protein M422DRAFT_247793 [Sphaerobolus stellatus SS14]|nr:hypothetical protein M422DRAFT_247793 [Sphaerobolus stellatus SS14]
MTERVGVDAAPLLALPPPPPPPPNLPLTNSCSHPASSIDDLGIQEGVAAVDNIEREGA